MFALGQKRTLKRVRAMPSGRVRSPEQFRMFGECYCTEQKQQQVYDAQLKTELFVRTHRAV